MARLLDLLEAAFVGLVAWAAASRARRVLVVLAVALAVVLPGLAALPVTDRDEARFAQATKQMLETGDLIDIRFQDDPRWKKPIGIYWMQAASVRLTGAGWTEIWAYRLPSALAILGAALLTVWAARPMIGRAGATIAGIVLATALLPVAEAHIAKTDAALALTAVAALGALARLMLGQGGAGAAAIFWAAIAAAILLKGPILPVIVLAALGWLWVGARARPPLARLRPLPGLAATAALVLPWLIAIMALSDGAFLAESLGRDLGAKLVEGQEKHWGPPGLYAGLVWLTFWPWAALLPLALPWAWARRRQPWLRLLAGWTIPFWLILEAVPTKLPHYVLPLYPALAILIGAWLAARLDLRGRADGQETELAAAGAVGPVRAGGVALAAGLPGLLLAAAILVLPLLLEGRVLWAALPFVAIGAVASLAAARAGLARRPIALAGAGLVAALALYPAALQIALPALASAFPSASIAALAARAAPCASGPLIAVGFREPSLVFLAGTETRLALPEEAAGLLAAEPGRMAMVEDRFRPALETALPAGIVLVERGRLEYFNYNRGARETAALIVPADPRWQACPVG